MMQGDIMQGYYLEQRGTHRLRLLGRLAPGATRDEAQAELDTLAEALAQEYPDTNEGERVAVLPLWRSPFEPGRTFFPMLMTLLAVSAFVLSISCANVANLLLARAMGRRREVAIRLSMGASRWRLVRQLLTESTLLYLLGGFLGFLTAHWTGSLLYGALMPPTPVPLKVELGTDTTVLLFAFLLTFATSLVFGLAPAVQTSRADLASSLKEGSRSSQAHGKLLRSGLVVAQVALSLLLLIGTGLFVRSLANAQSVDPGFDPSNTLIASLDLLPGGYDEEQGRVFYRQLIGRVEALPGVESACLARMVPLGYRGWSSRGLEIEGYVPAPGEDVDVPINSVGPNYFRTMRIPLAQGRPFHSSDDEDAPWVAIINETMAERYWTDRSALGGRFRMGRRWFQVVGIAGDGKYQTLNEARQPYFYVPLLQHYRQNVMLHVRTEGDPGGIVSQVREEVRALDPNLALFDVTTLSENMEVSLAFQSMGAMLLGVIGCVALTLACVGLYGVMAYMVAERTQEIGIRMALGARVVHVLRLVLGQGMVLTWVGAGIGLLAALGLTRYLSGLLLDVSATDPLVFGGVFLVNASAAALASFLPARRAARVDPVVALKYE
jgi:predicted permease